MSAPTPQPPAPFSPGVIVLGGGAVLLMAILLIGFLLPTDWEAEVTARLPAPPADVYALLDSPEGWRTWTPWPDSGLVREGPERGVGATMRWDDEELGTGSFRIASVDPGRGVTYQVEVGGGSMRTEGSIALAPDGDGVVVTWREQGNLGRNPLMGFWALFMDRAQTTELRKDLERLGQEALERGSAPGGAVPPARDAPPDTGATGAL